MTCWKIHVSYFLWQNVNNIRERRICCSKFLLLLVEGPVKNWTLQCWTTGWIFFFFCRAQKSFLPGRGVPKTIFGLDRSKVQQTSNFQLREVSAMMLHTHTRAHTHTHTWLGVCALTVPSRLPRAMSAYAERKAANRGEELRLNISSTQWNRVWLQSALTRDTPEAPIKSNLPNVSRLARCQTGQR